MHEYRTLTWVDPASEPALPDTLALVYCACGLWLVGPIDQDEHGIEHEMAMKYRAHLFAVIDASHRAEGL